MTRYARAARFLAFAIAGLLGACASTGPAPVEDLSSGSRQATAEQRRPDSRGAAQSADGTYRVQRGDTLYSIAFRHGLDYRELAVWNRIAAPYTIYVGQELRLASSARVAAAPPPARAAAPAMAAARVPPAPAAPKPAPFETVSAQSASAPASQGAPAPGTVAEAARSASPKASGTPAAAPVAPPSLVATGDIPWRWPADGQVVSGYVGGDPTRQGIDIGGKSGDPVRAAADGTVVYSGNGLIGYGELIIVKHSPAFLSAYGHNRKRLVKEGDHVAAGQVIAEMGSSSASRDSLHFEIRKNGKPANPTDYLPRR